MNLSRLRTLDRCCGTLLVLAALAVASGVAQADDSEHFGRFGELALYRESQHPNNVVLFVSADGGWNQGVVDMAKALSSLDALVVGIDIRIYLAAPCKSEEKCLYPASDFEALSQYLQKKLDFPSYRIPVLVGCSSGATLAYATLAQAPVNTFRGGIIRDAKASQQYVARVEGAEIVIVSGEVVAPRPTAARRSRRPTPGVGRPRRTGAWRSPPACSERPFSMATG